MHIFSILGLALLVCFAATKRKDGKSKGKDHEIPDDIQEVNRKAVNRVALIEEKLTGASESIFGKDNGVFTKEEMKEAKKLLKCIRKKAAAKHNHPDPDDDSIISDDIVKTLEQIEMEAEDYPDCKGLVQRSSRRPRQVPTFARRWNDNTVPWKFQTSSATNENLIRDSLAAIEAVTCIKFVELTSSDPEPSSFIRITDAAGQGCWSHIGRTGGGGQQLQLQADRGGGHCQWTGTIQHEFIHALGVHHEQVRSDRDQYVIINFENIQSGMEGNFEKCTNCIPNQTPYDYGSVMHYGKRSFSKNGQNTITPIPDSSVSLGQRDGLSERDIQLLNYLYPCPRGATDCGNCLTGREDRGCNVPAIEKCVCQKDSWCCNKNWDGYCVAIVQSGCQFECKKPAGGATDCGNCLTGRVDRGCNVPAIEKCVCQKDPWCCIKNWDSYCVAIVQSGCHEFECKKPGTGVF